MAAKATIRRAQPADAAVLTALALRSKAHWGYPEDFMRACEAELRVTAENIDDPGLAYFVALQGDDVAGFAALEFIGGPIAELEALFVEPALIGRGFGRELIQFAIRVAESRGITRLLIQGDPHAEDFYLAAGARPTGERESGSIPGRMLPLYELPLGHRPSANNNRRT
jgi:GNAT superfamily N-acetyltransferase